MKEMSYPVILNLKIPWLTRTFYFLFIICLIGIFIFGIYMLPSGNSSDEMKAAYFVLTTTEFEKAAFLVAVLGIPTFFISYRYIRRKRSAVLTLFSDKIEINDFRKVTSIAIDDIAKIACNDALTNDGFPKAKLTIDVKEKGKEVISMTLKDYSQSEKLMNKLLSYENITFNVTNFPSNPGVLDD